MNDKLEGQPNSYMSYTPSGLEWQQALIIQRVVEVFGETGKAVSWLSRHEEQYQTPEGIEILHEKLTQIDEGYSA